LPFCREEHARNLPQASLKEECSSFTCALQLGIDNNLASRKYKKLKGHEKAPNGSVVVNVSGRSGPPR
jgi:hypothetical protein